MGKSPTKVGLNELGANDTLEFHYQKPPGYRTVHADGFWGGSTPRGHFALSFFSERPPIPRTAKRNVLSRQGGQLVAGPEEVSETLSGLVRQIETTVMMDLRTVQELYLFMREHLAQFETIMGVPEADRVTKTDNADG